MPKFQPHQVRRLLPRHHKIFNRLLLGFNQHQIAENLGMSNRSISLIVNSPLVQSEVARRRKTIESMENKSIAGGTERARTILDEASASAAQTQVNLLDSTEDRLKHSAAKDILDRTIGSKLEGPKAIGVVIDADTSKLLKETFEQVRQELIDA